jgi:hypothetical protein
MLLRDSALPQGDRKFQIPLQSAGESPRPPLFQNRA